MILNHILKQIVFIGLSFIAVLQFLFCPVAIAATNDSIIYTERPRVGLVLSGGGAKGMAHVGALKVIEELGIPIDYIAGTSMGSIVGGLYALGYTSIQLEDYLKKADWENLLTDRVLRRHVSIYEKSERKRYWLQIPIKGRRIELPLGILTGQNVSNLFTELASPAYAQSDFSKFTIPFLCVATDIESGNEVVLQQGNLVKAMRASMAIPSVFTPEIIDSVQLYDGGLVNNFPANLLREKGIDILIGVDVSSLNQENKINNIYQVMEQAIFMSSMPLIEANRKLCKVLIIPEISEYSASSFNAVDSLIIRGERAAQAHYDELKALAVWLRSFEPDKPKELGICPQPLYSFYVEDIQINGLVNTSRDFFLQKTELKYPAEMTFAQLNYALEKIKGTRVYHSIVYQLNPLPDGAVELRFDCVEQRANMIRAGFLYDDEFKAALLLNLTLRNTLLDNSKASAELSIGANPAFSMSFLYTPDYWMKRKKRSKPGLSPDWLFHIDGYRIDAYNYLGNQRTTSYNFSNLSAGLELLLSPSVNNAIGLGVMGEYSLMKTNVGNEIRSKQESEYLYMKYRFFYERDSYNEDYFPTAGGSLRFEATYHDGFSKNVRNSDGHFALTFRSNFASSPTDRWTIHSGVDAGVIFGGVVPPHYMILLGGAPSKHLHNHMTFLGMYFLQRHERNAWIAHMNHQVRLWNNVYLTLRSNLAKAENELFELVTPTNFLIGCGVSAQYNTVVGPLGFTLSSSNVTKSLLGVIHFGFWF